MLTVADPARRSKFIHCIISMECLECWFKNLKI